MKFAKTYSIQPNLSKTSIVSVEADIAKGMHSFNIVGLPDKAVEEAKDRVSSAIKNTGFTSPKQQNQKITISLAPADLKKEGPIFDLGIAISYLLSNEELEANLDDSIFIGELGLDGTLKPVSGAMVATMQAKQKGFKNIFLPKQNENEASLIKGINIFGAETLAEIIEHLNGNKFIEKTKPFAFKNKNAKSEIDFGHIKGQSDAKRALTIAAAGGHNIAFWGPAGTGKTLLAKAIVGILPKMSEEEIIETTGIHSIAGLLKDTDILIERPWRNPHHTSSYVSIIGGGAIPKPGEATLSHKGVLFLDEFPEFDRRVIEALREPLEDKVIRISRARGSENFPADFMLVVALNPCPCGNFGTPNRKCTCMPSAIEKYKRKISGPIADRIDLWSEVSTISYKELGKDFEGELESPKIKKQIEKARDLQRKRFGKAKLNSNISVKEINKITNLTEEAKLALEQGGAVHNLSGRSFHKIIKIARTIADLEGVEKVSRDHILEALRFRPKKEIVGN